MMPALAPPGAGSAVVRARYDRLAPVYDAVEALAERLVVARWRALLWERGGEATDVLELGIGTGKNLAYHPRGAHVLGIDLSPAMLERARRRALRLGSAVELRVMDVEQLELPDRSFATVAATFLFCSVADPLRGLREARRVLRPAGRLLLLEHVRPNIEWFGRVLDLVDPLTTRLSGAHVNRRTVANVRAAGFRIDEVLDLAPAGLVQLIVGTVQ